MLPVRVLLQGAHVGLDAGENQLPVLVIARLQDLLYNVVPELVFHHRLGQGEKKSQPRMISCRPHEA